MNLPPKLEAKLKEESQEFMRLFRLTYQQLEGLELSFRPHLREMVVARHPNPQINKNCVALLLREHNGYRHIWADFRVDGLEVGTLFAGGRTAVVLHKYDKPPAKPLWCQVRIENRADVKTICTIAKSIIASSPTWGRR